MKNINSRWSILALVALALIAMTSGAAMAVTKFEVRVTWMNNDPTPEDLTLTVITYSDQGRLFEVDEIVMEYIGQDEGGNSIFGVQFLPNTSGQYWGVEVDIDNPQLEMWEDNPFQDQDAIDFDEDNILQFIHIDDL